jgi:ketosteroid isomerase-like protein
VANENGQVLKDMYDAVSKHDIERALSCFHNDGEFKNIAFNETFKGREQIKKMMESWLTAFPDLKLETANILGTGDWAVGELTVDGTHKGKFRTPAGELAPTNKHVRAPSCDVARIANGKIVSIRCYLESGTFLSQLGMKPARAAA